MDAEVIGPLAGLGGAVLGFLGGQINGHREAKSKREALETDLEKTRLELDDARKARQEVQEQEQKDREDEVRANLAKAIEDVVSGTQAGLLSARQESKARDATSAAKGSSKFDEDSNVKRAARKLDEALVDRDVKREATAIEARHLLNA